MNFKDSFAQRVALLKGMDENILSTVAQNLVLAEGAERVISKLKQLGYKIGIISGGFEYFGKYLQKKLGLDYVFANCLEIENGKVTGKIKGDIIDGRKKPKVCEPSPRSKTSASNKPLRLAMAPMTCQ